MDDSLSGAVLAMQGGHGDNCGRAARPGECSERGRHLCHAPGAAEPVAHAQQERCGCGSHEVRSCAASVTCSADSRCKLLTEQLRSVARAFRMLGKPCKGDQLYPSPLYIMAPIQSAPNVNRTKVASWVDACAFIFCRSSYKGAVKGVAYVASALDSHWERMRPELRSAIEGELASRKGRLSHTYYKPAGSAAEILRDAKHLQPRLCMRCSWPVAPYGFSSASL